MIDRYFPAMDSDGMPTLMRRVDGEWVKHEDHVVHMQECETAWKLELEAANKIIRRLENAVGDIAMTAADYLDRHANEHGAELANDVIQLAHESSKGDEA